MFTYLDNRALLKVSGADAENFLQSQFSNDVKQIQEGQLQINAYCQHQGKIIAILWVFKRNSNYYLSIPSELKTIVLSKLNMFKLMSQVEIEDYSSKINQYGLISENRKDSIKINDNLSLLTSTKILTDNQHNSDWELACIMDKLPEISVTNSENYIPQALNLDIDDMGVSFTKGCYPGQEVVARMHYLGKPKRRLFYFISSFGVKAGDRLRTDSSNSLKASGEVIRVSQKDNKYHFLATFEVNQIENKIFINDAKDKLATLIL